MVRVATLLLAAGLAALAGCQMPPPPEMVSAADVELVEEPRWRRVAAADDLDRVARIDAAWDEALAAARRAGHGRTIAREAELLDPAAALPMPAPTPGAYLCRLVRISAAEARRGAQLSAYRPFFCHVGVDGDFLTLIKQTGSERPAGHLWTDADPRRLVFLGSLALGGDDEPRAYGDSATRDMAGIFERIGDFRFRLVVPFPRTGATLEVYELVPAPVQPQD